MLVSAAISEKGAPGRIISFWHKTKSFEMLVSDELLFELEVVLLRRKFRRYLTTREALEYVMWLSDGGLALTPGQRVPPQPRP